MVVNGCCDDGDGGRVKLRLAAREPPPSFSKAPPTFAAKRTVLSFFFLFFFWLETITCRVVLSAQSRPDCPDHARTEQVNYQQRITIPTPSPPVQPEPAAGLAVPPLPSRRRRR